MIGDAARKLRKNIDEGVDLKEAIRLFTEDIEKVTEITQKEIDDFINHLR